MVINFKIALILTLILEVRGKTFSWKTSFMKSMKINYLQNFLPCGTKFYADIYHSVDSKVAFVT